jgi:DeoR/GlpR family transcriptional regulator of sugar metabolism
MQPNDLPDLRQAAILRQLKDDGRVRAGELAQQFGTSEDTIRRDLRDLAAAGLCRRVYGGALPLSSASGPLRERIGQAMDAKAALARRAATLVQPGETIVIDAGSTNLHIAQTLPCGRNLTIVTNAPGIAAILNERGGFDVIMIGGRVDPRTGSSFGPRACADMGEIRPDLAFVGTCAIAAHGLAAFDADEGAFKRLLVRNAARVVVAATSDKLMTMAPFRFAALSEIGILVVEADAPEALITQLGLDPVRVLRASGPGTKDLG